ncbi:MAG: hypothetical protein ABI137_04580 [Antricoccus sp.]
MTILSDHRFGCIRHAVKPAVSGSLDGYTKYWQQDISSVKTSGVTANVTASTVDFEVLYLRPDGSELFQHQVATLGAKDTSFVITAMGVAQVYYDTQ